MKIMRLFILSLVLLISNSHLFGSIGKGVSNIGKLNSYFTLTAQSVNNNSLIINWATLLSSGNVNIGYSLNRRLTWKNIVKNVNVNLLNYSWALPLNNTNNMRIKNDAVE